MKKLFSLMFMFVAFGLLLMGCSDSPQKVAKNWLQAIANGDVSEANKYSTENTHALNSLFVTMLKKAEDNDKDQFKDKDEKIKEGLKKFDDARVEIDGDTARIYNDDEDKPMILKKVDGDWKVDVQKQ